MTCERCGGSVLPDNELLRNDVVRVSRCLMCGHLQGEGPRAHEDPRKDGYQGVNPRHVEAMQQHAERRRSMEVKA